MNRMKYRLASVLVLASFASYAAHAALGESKASVQADAVQLSGSVRVTQHPTYQVQEIQLPSGTKLREFAAGDGKVFAVAWRGPAPPNLKQALGQYFDNYVAAAKVNRLGHHHLEISGSELVVHAAGHMRAFTGVAYLPQALPGGFDLGELQ
jgi:hypothetical protein